MWVLLLDGDRCTGWGILHTVALPHYNFPELEDLYIAPELRNRGHGGFLLAEIEALARDRGLKGVSLGVNPDENPDARRFYERHGYRHDGGGRRLDGVYDGHEDWTIGMEKTLEAGCYTWIPHHSKGASHSSCRPKPKPGSRGCSSM